MPIHSRSANWFLTIAEATVPSLDDWEKDWLENPQLSVQRKLLSMNFGLPLAAVAQTIETEN